MWCVNWRLGINVCVCQNSELRPGELFVCMSDVWIEVLGYMCVYIWCVNLTLVIYGSLCMMCERGLVIYVCVYVWRVNWSLGIYLFECPMCEFKAWDICVFISDVWIEGLGYMCVYIWCVKWRLRIHLCLSLMCELKPGDIFVCVSDV